MQNENPSQPLEALTPLDVSQAALEDEENPSAGRALAPHEYAIRFPGGAEAEDTCLSLLKTAARNALPLLGALAAIAIAARLVTGRKRLNRR